jgi:prepilin-type N-terminal cleavage/methylation domain-containing protein
MFKNFKRKKQKKIVNKIQDKQAGFSLIELMVVISIVAFISSSIFSAVYQIRIKSRDTKRIADIVQIQKALELYYSSNNQYPPHDTEIGCYGFDTSASGGFITALTNSNIISKAPKDPLGSPYSSNVDCVTTNKNYRYYRYSAGEWCNMCGNHKAWYVLGVNFLEGLTVHHTYRPGTQRVYCADPETGGGTLDFNTQFDWVTYKCESGF